MDQSTELTVTLLTEPDSNLTADGEAAPVDVQLVYLSDDSKFQPPITIRLPPPRCPTCWGRTISITGLQPVAGHRKNTAADQAG